MSRWRKMQKLQHPDFRRGKSVSAGRDSGGEGGHIFLPSWRGTRGHLLAAAVDDGLYLLNVETLARYIGGGADAGGLPHGEGYGGARG